MPSLVLSVLHRFFHLICRLSHSHHLFNTESYEADSTIIVFILQRTLKILRALSKDIQL